MISSEFIGRWTVELENRSAGQGSFMTKASRSTLPINSKGAWLLLGCALLLSATGCKDRSAIRNTAQAGSHLDFNQDVQPVLASNCFSCHGPDPAARKAGLRLDLEETALRKRPGKPDAIVPGHPELSELIKRVEAKNPHQLMPQSPEGEAKPMRPQDIAILKQWVAEGAHYRPHWAFEDPTRPAEPKVKDASWVRTSIDPFVLARLSKEGLQPSPEADKSTLIRRVTLDLTGLLPTPKEVAAFEKDTSPQAYEHVVDRLLASPAYGEQRARYWMDYARYGDTYGLHYDNNRHLWPYRDYVIRSFNANKPFDQFAREQIAGDLMPAKDLDPIIASGYVRAGVSTNEGGTIPEELRFNMARERAEAYGGAFMGLTVGCAVCHDHKYDPTSQKDFYQLTAFFSNMNELPFNGDKPDWAPVVRIPKADKLAAYNQVLTKRSELASQLRAAQLQERDLVERWIKSGQSQPLSVSAEALVLRLRLDEQGGDTLKNSAPHASPAAFPIGKFPPQWGETTWLWQDFRMDTTTRIMLGQTGDFDTKQQFSGGGWFMVRSAPNSPASKVSGALLSKMDVTQKNRGWDLATDQGVISVDLVSSATQLEPTPEKDKVPPTAPKLDLVAAKPAVQTPIHWPVIQGHALRVSTAVPVVKEGQWQHIFFTYDGSGKASGVRIYVDGVSVATKAVSDSLAGSTIRTQAPLQLGWRYPEAKPAKGTRYQDLRLYARALSPEEAKRLPYEDYVAELTAKPASQWNEDQWHVASAYYFDNVDASTKASQAQMRQYDAELEKLSAGGDLDIVSEERPTIAYAHVLSRGIYTARMERVEANTPHFLPPLPAGVPHDRLALANWTVSANNPLTARVTVNRMWNEVFGAGLVETTEDFGIMGGRPSDPQLLDWLAVEFRQSGWNVKHMYKLMVMSAAYRQASKSTPQQLARDPHNLLLAHGPRFRMDAEMLRDIALQSSGLLVDKIGGPSVRTYQPDRVWESVGIPQSDTTKYVQDHGEALYRRSLYTYWKRMALQPDMDVFDAPTRDTVCTRRQRTNTPLQALVTMDDVQWVEASRMLAERSIEEGGKQSHQRLQYLSEILLSRDLAPRTETVLEQSLKQMEEHYATDPKAAAELVAVGEKPRNRSIPAPELAAWTMVVSEMMNLDETLNK
jgi:hypothetical protein